MTDDEYFLVVRVLLPYFKVLCVWKGLPMCWMTACLITVMSASHPLPDPGPPPLAWPPFPDRLSAYVFLNWTLVPPDRLAAAIDARPEDLTCLAGLMGLDPDPPVSSEMTRRGYVTLTRRNWHLLPWDQLLQLLGWTADELAFALREDDFLYIKLGSLKPAAPPLRWTAPDPATESRLRRIGELIRRDFPDLSRSGADLFQFVRELSDPPASHSSSPAGPGDSPRFCGSYFALYGDPLLEDSQASFPDGYLRRLAAVGVRGTWLQGVLYKLAPFPWDPARSEDWEQRQQALGALARRTREQGIGLWLYLNEPRAMPLSFFEKHPELKGVTEGDYATLCTSVPEVRAWIRESVASICRAAPDLAGIFTISASENLTHCWSHFQGQGCARCAAAGAPEVVAALHEAIAAGMADAGSRARLVAWDWGWQDDWVESLVQRLPRQAALMSVSEWNLPLNRGGVAVSVGEYALSAIGPGPRAERHWNLARTAGLSCFAKLQLGTTWELGSVPYLPVPALVAEHAERLRARHLDGFMLGWTLGGCPSPNLEVFSRMMDHPDLSPEQALRAVAADRFGETAADLTVQAWQRISAAFRNYPYNFSLLYNGPQHMGPAAPLWETPTGYRATMVGFPYDDVPAWLGPYPADTFVTLMEQTAEGFEQGAGLMEQALSEMERGPNDTDHRNALEAEVRVIRACGLHFRSVARQVRFYQARDRLLRVKRPEDLAATFRELRDLAAMERNCARALYGIQRQDSRIGYEATNHYFYVPADLAARAVHCDLMAERWNALLRSIGDASVEHAES